MATLTEYLGSVDDTFNFGTANIIAMGFKIPAGATITGWGIVGSRGNNATAGTFRVEVYEGSGNPNAGTLILSEDYDRTVLPTYTASPTLQSFVFGTPSGVLTGGSTQYYLVITPLTGSSNDCVRWSTDNTSPTYADGNTWGWTSGTWTSYPTFDQNFQITGTTGGAVDTTKFFSLMMR